MKNLKKAFTLVELMVVITVIAILMTIAIVSFTRIQKQARDTKRKADMRTLQTALQAYYTENQTYPIVTVAELATTALVVLTPNYIPTIPLAPAGTAGATNPGYTYVSGVNGFTYSICNNLETATATGAMWVVSTSNAGGYGTTDGDCVPPEE
jgi:general secretion pathway protein G